VLDRVRHLQAANRERAWPAGHLALLGKLTDAEVAARTGRDKNGVRVKRSKLGIPNPSGPGWKAEELVRLSRGRIGILLGRNRQDSNPAPQKTDSLPGHVC
jgi:hypothetical protein